MEPPRPQLVILADAPDALCVLFGISLVERLLRIAQRLGFREAVVFANSEAVRAQLIRPSWPRAQVALTFRQRNSDPIAIREIAASARPVLVVLAGYYYDARLLATMAEQQPTTVLVDSAPPPDCAVLWKNRAAGAGTRQLQTIAAALVDPHWISRNDGATSLIEQLSSDAAAGRIATCDAACQPSYIMDLRKHVRPVFFPAPSPELIPVAERFPRHRAQNGVLDFPGYVNAPIENWIVARLCRSSITPNQVTFITMWIGLTVTALFATGHLLSGLLLAFTIEILDGVDGKLARTKVETTAAGKWEHVIDFIIELSWWTALAFHFRRTNLPSAYWLLLLYVGSDLVDRLAKRVVKSKVGRNLDDVANFDRFVRCIGTRRNINIWILGGALALSDASSGFVLICWWGAATAAAHVVRAFQIRARPAPVFKN